MRSSKKRIPIPPSSWWTSSPLFSGNKPSPEEELRRGPSVREGTTLSIINERAAFGVWGLLSVEVLIYEF